MAAPSPTLSRFLLMPLPNLHRAVIAGEWLEADTSGQLQAVLEATFMDAAAVPAPAALAALTG